MPLPTYGAAPLAHTFLLVRGLSLIAMVGIVGMTANFVSEIVSSNVDPPREVIGTLTITCIAALYCLISIPFFCARAHIGLFVMTGIDLLLLLAFVVISVILGRPLSFLNCTVIDDASAAGNADSAFDFAQSLASYLNVSGSTLDLGDWAGSTRANCFETKAIWGLCIALCILFSCSAMLLPALWWKSKKAASRPNKGMA